MKSKNNIKYYIYLRKSSEGEDRQIQSIERQADEVHKLITYQCLNVVGTFQENRSAMTPNNRPEFIKMIKGIKAGKANGIICWHMNRLARNPLESGIVQQLLEDGKIQSILTKDREYTPSDNAIIFSVESSLATQYSKDLGKMVKSGMEKRVSVGIAPIRAPIGYLNTKMAEHGSNYILKDPERFGVIKKLWETMLSSKYGGQELLRMFTKEFNLKTRPCKNSGNVFLHRSAIYKILTNPFYAGLFKYKGKLYQGKHPAMISMEEYDTVQKLLGKKGNPRQKTHTFPYTGFMTCSICGSAITAIEKVKLIKTTGKLKSYTYYYCTKRKKSALKCTFRKMIPSSELEDILFSEIESVSISEKLAYAAINLLKENINEFFEAEEALISQKQQEIIKIEKQINILLELRINESITDGEFQKGKIERENKIIQIKQHLKTSEKQSFNFLTIQKNIHSLINMADKFKKSTPEERKFMLISIGENWQIKDKKLLGNKYKWAEAVKKNKDGAEGEMKRLELNKYVDIKWFSKQFRDMFPSLCTLVDEVRTEQNTNDSKSPYLT